MDGRLFRKLALQVFRRLIQGRRIAIPKTHPSARGNQSGSNRQTNSGRPTGNDRTAALQIQLVHTFSWMHFEREHAARSIVLRMSGFPGCPTDAPYRKIGLTNYEWPRMALYSARSND